MKKTGLLNQPLSSVIAGMGHLDLLAIGDAGLPIPAGPERIDLAVSEGVPSFLSVLGAVLGELKVQGAIVASELPAHSPALYEALCALLADCPIEQIPHDSFKLRSAEARAIVRTGEFTPYANVILIAGVIF